MVEAGRFVTGSTSAPCSVRIRAWGALALAVLALSMAIWIVLPGPTPFLLLLSVGAPELAAPLLVLSITAWALAAVDARGTVVARMALGIAAAATGLAAAPLAQFPAVARRLDATMAAALGPSYWDAVPPSRRASTRSTPLSTLELFAGLRQSRVRLTPNLPFATVDGEQLTLDVYRPAAEGAERATRKEGTTFHPTIVQIYGGAWQRGAPSDNAAVARELAGRGFVVFAIDYRHAPRARWPAQLDDVRAALRWIRLHAAEYQADASRVALLGRSAGAHLAMLAAYAPDALLPVQAVVNFYGPVDLIEGYRHPPRPDPLDVRQIEITLFGGPPDAMAETYRAASPITYATRPLPPTLSIYGARDHIVEPRFGVMLDERLRATGTRSVLLLIPWADHAFDAIPNGPSGQLALYHTERFLAWALGTDRR